MPAPVPNYAFDTKRDGAQQPRLAQAAGGHARRRGDVGRRRQLGGRGDAGRRGLRRGRASRCSSTTTARRWRARAPAAPGATSTTRGGWPRRWASRTTCSTTRAGSATSVVEEFADAYLAGATPVPCIRCNERVKFRDLLETARDLDADCMATGHYVRRVDGAGRAGAAPRRRPGARPELLPVLDHAASSSASCASRSAGSPPRPRPGRWRRATGCRWPTSPTARTSASCRTAPTPR